MTRLFLVAALTFAAAVAPVVRVQAQTGAPDFPAAAPTTIPTPPPAANPRQSPADKAREDRRQRMSPEEARRDQQLEARAGGGTGNTSLSRGASQARQYEKRGGAFTVKKFKDKRPGAKKQKRGQTHMVGGIDPKGERLIDKKRKKHFLFF